MCIILFIIYPLLYLIWTSPAYGFLAETCSKLCNTMGCPLHRFYHFGFLFSPPGLERCLFVPAPGSTQPLGCLTFCVSLANYFLLFSGSPPTHYYRRFWQGPSEDSGSAWKTEDKDWANTWKSVGCGAYIFAYQNPSAAGRCTYWCKWYHFNVHCCLE